jgi:radical SAM superfamily enzyme YgiQ (UPF0313 family)
MVPLSLLTISAPLEKSGYDVKIVSAVDTCDYVNQILESLDSAICLGITCMTGYQIHNGLEIAKLVKEKHMDMPIVMGGYHASLLPSQTVANPYVDIVVRGQGEITFSELVHKLEKDLPLNDVLGITYKENGKIITNPDRPFEDVNNFLKPIPYHLIELEDHIRMSEIGSRTIEYISSQGCPYKCGFCCETMFSKRRWSGLNAQRVVRELEFLVSKYGINAVSFQDNNFFVDKERVRLICKGIKERNILIRWEAQGRIDQLCNFNDELWNLIKESGCHQILVGAESGSQHVLDFIGKGTTVEELIKLTEICKSVGIRIIYSFILGFLPLALGNPSLPYNKTMELVDKEFEQTFNLIRRIFSIENNSTVMMFIYTPYPGSEIFDLAKKFGFKEPTSLDEWSRFEFNRINVPWVPKKYIKLTKLLNDYIFPFIGRSGNYHTMLNMTPRFIRPILRPVCEILRRTAHFRLKNNFFSFPIEYILLTRSIHLGRGIQFWLETKKKNITSTERTQML